MEEYMDSGIKISNDMILKTFFRMFLGLLATAIIAFFTNLSFSSLCFIVSPTAIAVPAPTSNFGICLFNLFINCSKIFF